MLKPPKSLPPGNSFVDSPPIAVAHMMILQGSGGLFEA